MRLTLLVPIVLATACCGGAPAQAAITTTGDVMPQYDGTDPWSVPDNPFFVGNAGTGSLTIDAASSVVDIDGIIANAANSSGTVTVTGAGSTWANIGLLRVGARGEGQLTIVDGGRVENSINCFLGTFPGATGTVTVTGTGSTWNNAGGFRVGSEGSGTLVIADGGNVDNGTAGIGRFAGATGLVTVAGAGSTWTNRGDLFVGDSGDGTLEIKNGGSVSNATGRIGNNIGSTGAVTVTGAGSTWENSGLVSVGNAGIGNLAIFDGGSVSSSDGMIGANSTVTLSGGSANWTMTGAFDMTTGGGTATLAIGISGLTEHGSVNISGLAQLAGQLQLDLIDDFVPVSMDAFTVLTAGSAIAGQFSNIASGQRLDTADGLGSFLVHYGNGSPFAPNQIVLTGFELAPALAGDYNGDGTVDAADYVVWRDGNGSQDEYNAWRANFANSLASGVATDVSDPSPAVPGPATLILLSVAIALSLGVESRERGADSGEQRAESWTLSSLLLALCS
jgi:T5SS/PEP-CTERM-associated repeat protein